MDGSQTFTLTLDQLVRFAQEGWQYPLRDDDATRKQVVESVEMIQRGDAPCVVLDGVCVECGATEPGECGRL